MLTWSNNVSDKEITVPVNTVMNSKLNWQLKQSEAYLTHSGVEY